MEELKDIPNYEGLYAITRDGRIWSYSSNQFKDLQIGNTGYYYTVLWKNSQPKWTTVHRLVAETYIPNPDNLPIINHKDQNKSNNSVENLEWCTIQYNNAYTNNKKVICLDTGEVFESVKAAAMSVGRKINSMSTHLHGRTASCGGRHFKFLQEVI